MEREDFLIPNITCDGCKKTIEETLKKLGGVRELEVDVPTRTVTVFHQENTSRERIKAALDEAGYIVQEEAQR